MSSYNDGVYTTASLTGAKYTTSSKQPGETWAPQYTTSTVDQHGQTYSTSNVYTSQTANEPNTYSTTTYTNGVKAGYSTGATAHMSNTATYSNTTTSGQIRQQSGNIVSQTYGEPHETGEVRKVSSVVVDQQYVGEKPQDTERYVEVPTYQEEVKYVPVKEVREVEKKVPVYDVEYVDKIVEVPKIEYVDRVVEVPVYTDVVKEVKVPQYVDRPVDVIREVRVPKTRVVEKTVEVPGEIVYVDKPYNVTKEVETIHNVNIEVPVIVAQTARPVITEAGGQVSVSARDIQPEIIPVDIHLAKPVDSCLQPVGVIRSHHKLTQISAEEYNTLLRRLNPSIHDELPFIAKDGHVMFAAKCDYVEVPKNVTIEGWVPKTTSQHHGGTSTTIETTNGKRSVDASANFGAYTMNNTTTTTTTTTSQPTVTATHQSSTMMPSQLSAGAPRYQRTSSSGSSVSSSINKIAYEVEQQQQQHKRQSMMCCGNQRQVSQSAQLTYPASQSMQQPSTVVVQTDNTVVAGAPAYATAEPTYSISSTRNGATRRVC